jgi:hypothetical protein
VSAAPDYVQPISGWRTWLVAEVDGKPRLASVFYYALWPVRRELVSECLARRSPLRLVNRRAEVESHATPGQRCACGIYAAREPRTALNYLQTCGPRDVGEVEGRAVLHRVLGRVVLWGRLIECDAGWRGAFAYPQCLFLPERTRSGDPVRPGRRRALAHRLRRTGPDPRRCRQRGGDHRGAAGASCRRLSATRYARADNRRAHERRSAIEISPQPGRALLVREVQAGRSLVAVGPCRCRNFRAG